MLKSMDEYHLELLRKSRPLIVQNLADIEAVCDHLIANGILSESMAETIMSKPSNASKTRELLNLMVTRGPKAFDIFYQVLVSTKNQLIADILKPPPRLQKASSSKLTRTLSLPSPECEPEGSALLKCATIDRRARKSSPSRQHRIDDAKTEYGDYDKEMLQNKPTLSSTAQVSEDDNHSSDILVSGSDQHFTCNPSEDEVGDIQRDIKGIQQNSILNISHYPEDQISVPSTSLAVQDQIHISGVQTEQGHQVRVASSDRHSPVAESSSLSQLEKEEEEEEREEEEHEGLSWPRTRKQSRPLNHLTIHKPSREQLQQMCMEITDNKVYSVNPNSQRRLVIVNNTVFMPSTGLPPRPTGDMDATTLDLLFKKMNYTTKVYNNCSCKKMIDVLSKERSLLNELLDNMDRFILVVLSHGKGEKVYGTEGSTIDIQEITQLFDNQHCPALIGKPKLFFIEACPGQQDKPQEISDSDWEHVDYDSLSMSMLNSFVSMETDDGRTESTDMFVARATTQCNATFQGRHFGSQFIQALIHVIKEYSYTDDVITLMSKMNELVRRPGDRPLVEYSDSLSKKFYFFIDSVHSLTMTV